MKKLLVAGVVVIAGLLVWLALHDRAAEAAPQATIPLPAEGEGQPARLDGATPLTGSTAVAQPAPDRTEATVPAAETTATANASATVTVKGRCVDAAGAPLAGVAARLNGWQANEQRYDAYVREHGEVQWQD